MLEDFGRKKHSYTYFVLLGIIVFAVFVFQSSLMFLPKIFGVLPMPMLAMVIAAGFFNSENTGFTVGLASGLLCDLISVKFPGFYALIFIAAGLGAALLAEYMINRRFFPCLLTALVICIVFYLIYWVSFNSDQGIYYFLRVSIPQTIYTWVFMIPFYYIFKFLSGRLLK